jgi:hypothetical protein
LNVYYSKREVPSSSVQERKTLDEEARLETNCIGKKHEGEREKIGVKARGTVVARSRAFEQLETISLRSIEVFDAPAKKTVRPTQCHTTFTSFPPLLAISRPKSRRERISPL